MHTSTYLRMEWFVRTHLSGARRKVSVLDVGSCDVNGTYRTIFDSDAFDYRGLDIESGVGVDIVAENPYKWDMIPSDSFDAVISGQTLEHVEFFWFTLAEMARVLRPGGLMCVIVPRNLVRHRHPVDTYRYDVDGMVAMGRYVDFEIVHASMNLAPPGSPREWYDDEQGDAMLVARKPEDWRGVVAPETYAYAPAPLDELATGFVDDRIFKLAGELNAGSGASVVEAVRYCLSLPEEGGWCEYFVDEFAFSRNGELRISGWAIDEKERKPLLGMFLEINGVCLWCRYGGARRDIDAIWKGCLESGFFCSVPVAAPDGRKMKITACLVSSDASKRSSFEVTGKGR